MAYYGPAAIAPASLIQVVLAHVHHKFNVIVITVVAVKLDYHAHLSATVRQN